MLFCDVSLEKRVMFQFCGKSPPPPSPEYLRELTVLCERVE